MHMVMRSTAIETLLFPCLPLNNVPIIHKFVSNFVQERDYTFEDVIIGNFH